MSEQEYADLMRKCWSRRYKPTCFNGGKVFIGWCGSALCGGPVGIPTGHPSWEPATTGCDRCGREAVKCEAPTITMKKRDED